MNFYVVGMAIFVPAIVFQRLVIERSRVKCGQWKAL